MKIQAAAVASAMLLASSSAFAQDFRTIELASPALKKGAAVDGCRPEKTGRAGGPVHWQVFKPAGEKSGATIAETSREPVDPKYPICIFDNIRATDVEISVDLTPLEGDIDRAGGLAVRVIDPNNYYVVRANALEHNVRLYHVVKGARDQFAGIAENVFSGRPQQLRLRVEGDRFTVEFNHRKLFDARDSTFKGSGAVALWTKADSLTEFSNLTVKILKD